MNSQSAIAIGKRAEHTFVLGCAKEFLVEVVASEPQVLLVYLLAERTGTGFCVLVRDDDDGNSSSLGFGFEDEGFDDCVRRWDTRRGRHSRLPLCGRRGSRVGDCYSLAEGLGHC